MPIGVDYREIIDKDNKITKLKRDEELVLAELSLLLNLDKHSLFFGNNMGLDLSKYLHLTNKLAVFNLVKSDIEEFFKTYRRARLVNISIKFDSIESKLIIDLVIDIAGTLATLPLSVSN